MLDYWARHSDKLLRLTAQHMGLSLAAVGISFVLAFAAAMLMLRNKAIALSFSGLCNALFAVPTLALFSLLIPFTGLGKTTAIVTMVIYNQYQLTKSICSAFDAVDTTVLEAAAAIGMSRGQIFTGVKLPLAMPLLLNGLKIALSTTISGATLAALIGAGGLGELIFFGLSMKSWNQVLWGVVLSCACALAANILLQFLQDRAQQHAHGG